jgi:MFS family permease
VAEVGPARRPHPQVRWLVAASAVSNTGDGMALVALPWIASLLTREPLLVGLVGTSVQLAWIGGPLIVSPIIDRASRLWLMQTSLILQSAIAGVLGGVILIGFDLGDWRLNESAGYLGIAILMAAVLGLGVAEVVRDLAAEALLPEITSKESLERSNGRLLTAELIASRFVGQPLGGLLLTIGAAIPLLLDALSFLASALLLSPLKQRRPADAPAKAPAKLTIRDGIDGLRWLWRVRVLRSMTLALAWTNLMSGIAVAILVLYVQDVLNLGSVQYGALLTAGAAGGVLGGAGADRLITRFGPGPVTIGCIVAKAFAYWILTISGTVSGAGIALAILGASTMPWSVASRSLRQRLAPPEILGRVSGAHRTLNFGAIPVGMLVGGAIASAGTATLAVPTALRVPFLVAALGMTLLVPIATREFGLQSFWGGAGEGTDAPGEPA